MSGIEPLSAISPFLGGPRCPPTSKSKNPSFFLSLVANNQLNHWNSWVVSTQLIAQDPKNCKISLLLSFFLSRGKKNGWQIPNLIMPFWQCVFGQCVFGWIPSTTALAADHRPDNLNKNLIEQRAVMNVFLEKCRQGSFSWKVHSQVFNFPEGALSGFRCFENCAVAFFPLLKVHRDPQKCAVTIFLCVKVRRYRLFSKKLCGQRLFPVKTWHFFFPLYFWSVY